VTGRARPVRGGVVFCLGHILGGQRPRRALDSIDVGERELPISEKASMPIPAVLSPRRTIWLDEGPNMPGGKREQPLVIGLNGPLGSGATTTSRVLVNKKEE
jgi:hypothetical protein